MSKSRSENALLSPAAVVMGQRCHSAFVPVRVATSTSVDVKPCSRASMRWSAPRATVAWPGSDVDA